MDFKSFNSVKTSNGAFEVSQEKEVILKNGIPNTGNWKEIYQGCSGTCGTECTHYIIGGIVKCKYCGYEYKLR